MESTIQFLLSSPTVYILVVVLGLIMGSFLNVVIYRYPKILKQQWQHEANCYLNDTPYTPQTSEFNLCKPRSHCPHCQFEFPAWHNIPILSYLLLRGRCGQCHQHISIRYPLVEILTACLSLIVIIQMGTSPLALYSVLFTWGLVAQSFIDADHQFIPDTITYVLMWLGLLLSAVNLNIIDAAGSIIGAVVGYLILWVIAKLFYLLRKKEGMGHGDFKLLAMFGAWLGASMLPIVLVIASLCSLIFSLILLLNKKMQGDTPMPFGPFLAIGGWIGLLWGNDIMQFLSLVYT